MKPQPPQKQLGIIDKQNLESFSAEKAVSRSNVKKSKSINNSKLNLVETNSGDDAAVSTESMTKENDFLKWGQPKEQNSKFFTYAKPLVRFL